MLKDEKKRIFMKKAIMTTLILSFGVSSATNFLAKISKDDAKFITGNELVLPVIGEGNPVGGVNSIFARSRNRFLYWFG